jgi:hypothetical protein
VSRPRLAGTNKPKGAKKKPRRARLLIAHDGAEDAGGKPRAPPLDDAYFVQLCDYIAGGKSLRSFGTKTHRDPAILVRWIRRSPDRTKTYREARQMQADAHIDELFDLADTAMPIDDFGRVDSGAVNQLRLRVDTRKWIASKYHPAMYGEKVDANVNLSLASLTPDEIKKRLAALFAESGLRLVPAETASDGPSKPD